MDIESDTTDERVPKRKMENEKNGETPEKKLCLENSNGRSPTYDGEREKELKRCLSESPILGQISSSAIQKDDKGQDLGNNEEDQDPIYSNDLPQKDTDSNLIDSSNIGAEVDSNCEQYFGVKYLEPKGQESVEGLQPKEQESVEHLEPKEKESVEDLEPEKQEENLPDENSTSDTAQSSNTPSPPRQKCKYGSQCYRVSAEHKTKFSHPGDPDYDVADNRPECPYGTQCYRKNPQHKLDYRHTKTTRKRAKTSVRPESPNESEDDSSEESVDESEYEPSFIDDDDDLGEIESDEFKDEEE